MRNGVSLLKHYPQPSGLSRTAAATWTVVSRFGAVALVLGVGLAPGRAADAPPLQLPGRAAPDLARLFLPRHAPPGSYQLAVLDAPIEAARDRVMETLAPGTRPDSHSQAWAVTRTDPLEAYGDGGLYDHSRLARLYSGRPALVVRAPVTRDGRAAGSVTLISPYPDAALTRLNPGTMAILFLAVQR